MADRVCVLVLGMHRSGTSALARVLSLLGCDVPANLLEANDGNKKGYWESRPIMELNNRILKSGGSEWYDCQRFNPNWFNSVIVKKFKDEARKILDSEYGSSDLFVFKDPRICILLPFWLNILEECGIRAVPVLTVRNPLEVAASLERRHPFQASHALLLWLRYNLEAERETRHLRRIFTSYDRLLNEPQAFVTRSEALLRMAWPRNSTRTMAEIEEFLSVDLRNYIQPSAHQMRLPVAQDWIRTTHDILGRWTEEEPTEDDIASLEKIYDDFNLGLSNFGRLVDDNSRLSLQVRKLTSELDDLSNVAHESHGIKDEKSVSDLEKQIKLLEEQRLSLETKNVALEKGVKKLQRELEHVQKVQK